MKGAKDAPDSGAMKGATDPISLASFNVLSLATNTLQTDESSTENLHEWHKYSEERNTYIALDTIQHSVVVMEFDLALPNHLHDPHIRIKNIAPFRRQQIRAHVSTGAAWSGCRTVNLDSCASMFEADGACK